MRMKKVLVWVATATLVILLARTIAYALQPGFTARLLEQQAGGPAFPALVLVTLTLGAAFAVGVCSLAALGVRERVLLERRILVAPLPQIRADRVLAQAFVLAVLTSLAGGLFDAYLHWRAGVGWHGLHCLVGPVHRNLIPIESALSLVAAAVLEAARHECSKDTIKALDWISHLPSDEQGVAQWPSFFSEISASFRTSSNSLFCSS